MRERGLSEDLGGSIARIRSAVKKTKRSKPQSKSADLALETVDATVRVPETDSCEAEGDLASPRRNSTVGERNEEEYMGRLHLFDDTQQALVLEVEEGILEYKYKQQG